MVCIVPMSSSLKKSKQLFKGKLSSLQKTKIFMYVNIAEFVICIYQLNFTRF